MDPKYIIVQAGGKGSRMGYLTENKPKALVPIQNRPVLFHLMERYPDKRFIVIGDYKCDVLMRYLNTFAEVPFIVVNAQGHSGTCAGIRAALDYIPEDESFMLIWSDLILTDNFQFPTEEGSHIGLSGDFVCRWRYENGVFSEESSYKYGVAGLFLFESKSKIRDVPDDGEFVRWLQQKGMELKQFTLLGTKEYGLLSEYEKMSAIKCRPFNQMKEEDGIIVKKGLTQQGNQLAKFEREWYQKAKEAGFTDIPRIYRYEPLTMEKIDGGSIFEYEMDDKEKRVVLEKIIKAIKRLHSMGKNPTDYFSMREHYIEKTFKRLEKVRNLVPFTDRKIIKINGRQCRNIFFAREAVEEKVNQLKCNGFRFIHGDCTFSNIILRDGEPVLIDPRGYFGYTPIYGDAAYDWAKLYYSIVGNYDRFNIKDFRLEVRQNDVSITVGSNGWENMEEEFLRLVADDVCMDQLKLIHALIWLSLTTYAWEDYDSICGAFYNGLWYLEEIL